MGSIIFQLLPAGSITGAPKKKTMQIIKEAETYDRGFYTGVMGYSDGIDLDSAVMIRFVVPEPMLFFVPVCSMLGILSVNLADNKERI